MNTNSSVRLQSELQISNIETNKIFGRLLEKTQVAFPRQGQPEVIRNRLTHSYEVATSASIMAMFIAEQNQWDAMAVDYQGSVKPCSLLHDIGHAPLGHSSVPVLDDYFKKKGLTEGFTDNNNTLTVIEKNNIMVSSYTICSVIKYPNELYQSQKDKYLGLLSRAIEEDRKHFHTLGLTLKEQTRTIACQIMDEADRNTYICSDLADFFCLGNTIDIAILKSKAHQNKLVYRYTELNTLIAILRSGDKSAIRSYFNNLKNQFNMNYTLSEDGITVLNKDLNDYREFLWEIEFEFYISPLREMPFHQENMRKLCDYIKKVVEGNFTPSRHYAHAINVAKTNEQKLRAQCDMIAETTDWYVTQIHLRAQSADSVPNKPLPQMFGVHYPDSMAS